MAFDPQSSFGRLPLIAEYNGICRRDGAPITGRSPLRFEGCNQGRFQNECPHARNNEIRISRRFSVRARTDTTLQIIVLEEADHTPVRWREVVYHIAERTISDAGGNEVERAQIQAFCAGYLHLLSHTA